MAMASVDAVSNVLDAADRVDAIVLAAGSDAASRLPAADASLAGEYGPSKIMVVDDEPINVKAVCKYLKMAGYVNVTGVTDPREALRSIRAAPPDLLLLDIVMPGINGLEILQQLRADPALKHLPVIVLTAMADPETRHGALLMGATEFLSKPADIAELLARVRNSLTAKVYGDRLKSYAKELERQVQLDVLDVRRDPLDEDAEARLRSQREAPAGRSTAMAGQLAPPARQPEPRRPSERLEEAPRRGNEGFLPSAPGSLRELGVRNTDVEAIVLKFLLNSGPHTGFEIARQLRVPLSLLSVLLRQLKEEQLLVYKSVAAAGDFVHALTEVGIQRARRYWEHCTYFGTVPVSLDDYVASVHAQSVRKQNPKVREIRRVLDGLFVPQEMIIRLAQAVNSGLGLFLFGAPGNGKTTIACRLAQAFGEAVWIPRALNVGGSIMRLYDPNNHVSRPLTAEEACRLSSIDERWIRIRRPTVVAGGELSLDSFEVRTDQTTGVSEAPIQLKSNCGVLVIDDFGRQRVTPAEILNRWIVPLAQRFDILSLRNGRKFEFPIDQLVVFSTNLEPKALVDEAFLRRIPYKIDVGNPSEDEFRALLKKIANEWGIKHQDGPVDYLIEKCYRSCRREMRYCHPADILHQVCTYCNVLEAPLEITDQAIDAAAKNYFTLL